MKSIIAILVVFFTLNANAQFESIGAKIKAKNAVPAIEFAQKAQSEEPVNAKLIGEVESVCEVKGCWMKLKLADGKSMRVSFKDYGFFMPKDIVGKTVIIEGEAKVKSTPVDELKHYAEDAGKSKEEIAKIIMPEKALTFVANGVLIKK